MWHQAELQSLIEAELVKDHMASWCERFDAAGVPVGPVNTVGEALEHPQTRAAGMVVDVPDGLPGCTRSLGPAVTLDSRYGQTPATSAPPRVGQHTVAILEGFGFGGDEIRELVAAGVVGNDTATQAG